jgi:hypothetical protein
VSRITGAIIDIGDEKMKIELTEHQYRKLVELVYLGNWLANAFKLSDEADQEYKELEQLILSYSENFDMKSLIMYDEKLAKYFPTQEFDKLVDPIIDQYDDYSFWENLSSKLALRDLFREIGPVSKLTDQHMKRRFEIEERYELEFEKNGLKNLELKDSIKPVKKR